MNKKRRVIFVAALVALFCAIAGIVLTARRVPPQPVYQGKTLSQWLEIYDPTNASFRLTRELDASRAAIRHMGTNAIPTLLWMLENRDSRLKLWAMNLARKQHVIDFQFDSEVNRYERATMGLEALRPDAEGAVPGLLKLYEQDPLPYSRVRISQVLGRIGRPAHAAVPVLLRDVNNTNEFVSALAISALGSIHANPELVVPALTRSLQNPSVLSRYYAAQALGNFGPDAKAAVPALLTVLKNPGSNTNTNTNLSSFYVFVQANLPATITAALHEIDPQAVASLSTNDASSQPKQSP